MESPYSENDLKKALDSLWKNDSLRPDYDCRHVYGYKDPDHKLSMLQTITATVVLDYEAKLLQAHRSLEDLEQDGKAFAAEHGSILDLRRIIQEQSPRMALAAEFKRASPSKGDIAVDKNAGEQAVQYTAAGADIISVLTEPRWFKGSLQDLTEVRLQTTRHVAEQDRTRPVILRKEFVVNEYMIAEAAAAGADTVLLIVAILPQHLLKRLIEYTRKLGMEPLVEVHANEEVEVALEAGAKVIGVNNRNLHTFEMDMSTSERVASILESNQLSFRHDQSNNREESDRPDYVLSALSGMSTAQDVDRYRRVGIGMCLIGESLMRAADPTVAIANLCLHPLDYEKKHGSSGGELAAGTTEDPSSGYTAGTKIVKVCGITNPEDATVACQAGANLIGVIFAPRSKRVVTAEMAREVVQAVRRFGERKESSEPATSALLKSLASSSANADPVRDLRIRSDLLAQAAVRPLVVGVFQNQEPSFIQQMVEECSLDLVQLHGSEGMEAANYAKCGNVPVLRVVDIATDPNAPSKASDTAVEQIIDSLSSDPAAILLDTSIKGRKGGGGGTGVAFDWTIAKRLQEEFGLPVLIAGGLTPDSVAECVSSMRPYGVDVSSGVEAQPGQKDHSKVRAFVQNARKATQ